MKDETRARYHATLYKGKQTMARLSQAMDLAVENGGTPTVESVDEFNNLVQRAQEIELMLADPTAISTMITNKLQGFNTKLWSLYKEVTGDFPVTMEEVNQTDVEEGSPNAQILELLQQAEQSLLHAYQIAVTANSIAESVPVFQQIKSDASKMRVMMQEIGRLRSLK